MVDSGHPHNFMVNSWVFKNDESETDAKINNRLQVCPLLAWRVHAQSVLGTLWVYTRTADRHVHQHRLNEARELVQPQSE